MPYTIDLTFTSSLNRHLNIFEFKMNEKSIENKTISVGIYVTEFQSFPTLLSFDLFFQFNFKYNLF